jgi:PAB1-binding protein PBP1
MNKIGAIITSILLLGLLISNIGCLQDVKEEGKPVIGGKCVYSSYSGIATIMRVEKTEASKEQAEALGGPGYEGYEVWFVFKTDQEIKEELGQDIPEREHLFQLDNSWYPGPQYLEKYDIEVNKTYECTLKVIKEGTCSPIVFEFSEINTHDYFESEK